MFYPDLVSDQSIPLGPQYNTVNSQTTPLFTDHDDIVATVVSLNSVCRSMDPSLSTTLTEVCKKLMSSSVETRRLFLCLNGHGPLIDFISHVSNHLRLQLQKLHYPTEFYSAAFDGSLSTSDSFELLCQPVPLSTSVTFPTNVTPAALIHAVGVIKYLSIDCYNADNPDDSDEEKDDDTIESMLTNNFVITPSLAEDLITLAMSTPLASSDFFGTSEPLEFLVVVSSAAAEALNFSSSDLLSKPNCINTQQALPLPGSLVAFSLMKPVEFCLFSRVLGPLTALPNPSVLDNHFGLIRLIENGLDTLPSPFVHPSPISSSYVHSLLSSLDFLPCRLGLMLSLQCLVAPFCSKFMDDEMFSFIIRLVGAPNTDSLLSQLKQPNKRSRAKRDLLQTIAASAVLFLPRTQSSGYSWSEISQVIVSKRGLDLSSAEDFTLRQLRLLNLGRGDRNLNSILELVLSGCRAELLLTMASLSNGPFRSFFLKKLFSAPLPCFLSLKHSLGLLAQRRWDPQVGSVSKFTQARCFDHRHDILVAACARLLFTISSSFSTDSLGALTGLNERTLEGIDTDQLELVVEHNPNSVFGVLVKTARVLSYTFPNEEELLEEDDEHLPNSNTTASDLLRCNRLIGISRLLPFFDSFLHTDHPKFLCARRPEEHSILKTRALLVRKAGLIPIVIDNILVDLDTGPNRLESCFDFLGSCLRFPLLRSVVSECVNGEQGEKFFEIVRNHCSESALFIRSLVFECNFQKDYNPFEPVLQQFSDQILHSGDVLKKLLTNINLTNIQRGNICVFNSALMILYLNSPLLDTISFSKKETDALFDFIRMWKKTYLIAQAEITSFYASCSLPLRRSLPGIVERLLTKLSVKGKA
ncbi:hypothetical protein P9112_002598 [Eukaryota sp. TZLM1-RC]